MVKILTEKKQPITQIKRSHYPIWVICSQVGNQWSTYRGITRELFKRILLNQQDILHELQPAGCELQHNIRKLIHDKRADHNFDTAAES